MRSVLGHCLDRLHLPHQHVAVTDHVALDRRLCAACFLCVEACSRGVLGKVEMGPHRHAVIRDPGACAGCLKCVRVCEAGALTRRGPMAARA
jgi:NAD-dependent dihydropyrimidine dehydrogenase PreA subunit